MSSTNVKGETSNVISVDEKYKKSSFRNVILIKINGGG